MKNLCVCCMSFSVVIFLYNYYIFIRFLNFEAKISFRLLSISSKISSRKFLFDKYNCVRVMKHLYTLSKYFFGWTSISFSNFYYVNNLIMGKKNLRILIVRNLEFLKLYQYIFIPFNISILKPNTCFRLGSR